MGKYVLTDGMGAEVTHLVVGKKCRTLKLFEALARGIWVIHVNWITSGCVEAGTWVPEEKYEARDWYPGARLSRIARGIGNRCWVQCNVLRYRLTTQILLCAI
jgi:hypothetical protein